MAKDKEKAREHKIMHGVYKAGGKYHCGECSTEIDFGDSCPTCKKEFDWAKVEASIRRG